MPFPEDVVKQRFQDAGGKCECLFKRCKHPRRPGRNKCGNPLKWSDRGKTWEPHHVVAEEDGGPDTYDNCRILCGPSTKEGTCHYNVHH